MATAPQAPKYLSDPADFSNVAAESGYSGAFIDTGFTVGTSALTGRDTTKFDQFLTAAIDYPDTSFSVFFRLRYGSVFTFPYSDGRFFNEGGYIADKDRVNVYPTTGQFEDIFYSSQLKEFKAANDGSDWNAVFLSFTPAATPFARVNSETATSGNRTYSSSTRIVFGSLSGSQSFNGEISDLCLFNYSLPTSESDWLFDPLNDPATLLGGAIEAATNVFLNPVFENPTFRSSTLR